MNAPACHCGGLAVVQGRCTYCQRAGCLARPYACGRPDRKTAGDTIDKRRFANMVNPRRPSPEPMYVADPHGDPSYNWPQYTAGVVDALASAWIDVREHWREGETREDRIARRADITDWALEMGPEIARAVVNECRNREAAWLRSL